MSQLPVFDGHNDTLIDLYAPEEGEECSFFERSEKGHIDLPRAREGGLIGGLFGIFTPAPPGSRERDREYGLTVTEEGYRVKPRSAVDPRYSREFTAEVIDFAYGLEQKAEEEMALVRGHEDLEYNLQRGVLSVVLHLEGASAIKEDLSNLEEYYSKGVRSLGLVWSRPNVFGHGVPFMFPHSPDTGPGLTEAGRELVKECNHLGILIDLAHINERGFWDVAELSDAPLVVSHAGAHAICASTRNLTDEQIDAVGESKGLVGIIFAPSMTRADGKREEDIPVSGIVRHIAYVVERIGVDRVGLGSDFDGAQMPSELADVAHLPNLIQALRDRGYDHDSLEKIAYRNWFRVLRDSWKG
ncbi:MAG TPA: dipeptidase [Anaerolineae bacterium]|nr:dipeptidase [Anaerolineae bacterium]